MKILQRLSTLESNFSMNSDYIEELVLEDNYWPNDRSSMSKRYSSKP